MKINMTYEFIHGGKYNGLPCIAIRPGTVDVEPDELQNLIKENMTDLGMQLHILSLDTRSKSFPMEDIGNIMKIMEALKSEHRTAIIALCNGGEKPVYLSLVYSIVYITEAPWLQYRATEIRFVPTEVPIKEPDCGSENPIQTPKFVVASRETLQNSIMFIQGAKLAWGVLMPIAHSISVALL
jgi:hypothetical protein